MGDKEGEDRKPQNEVLTVDMGAAMIESETEKLRSLLAMKDGSCGHEFIDELKELASLMREKKLEEGSRLDYLTSEVVELVRHAGCQLENDSDDILDILKLLKQTNIQLREEGWRPEEDGVGEEDELGDDTVGLEEDVKLLLDKIDMSKEKPLVAWIRGMVGSGKTTLAKLVYNHPDVVRKFEPRVWVDCRKILSWKELLINIMRQVCGGDDYPKGKVAIEMKLVELAKMLAKQLQDKRFFIVLDHTGEGQFWVDCITIYLRHHATEGGSVLLVPSRSTNYHNGVGTYEHTMKALDLDKSWKLLGEKMLRGDDKFPKHAERKGKLVLMKHTGGLPLAIKEAAMEWAEKRGQGIEWEAIVDSDHLELRATLEAVDLSFYNRLKPVNKSIFLHLGFFKLGETIRQQKFKHTFAASGVLNSSDNDTLIDNYRYYSMSVEYLENMKIIEPKKKDIRVIPIYHKLSIVKAKKGNDGGHLGVIYCSRERFNGSTDQNGGGLICVSFKGGGCLDASISYWKCFEQLRVLDFEGFGLRFLPETVGGLMELRYLGLRNNYIQELPQWLRKLKKLEVLDISLNFMVKVPDIIWEMDALVHLYISDIVCREPLKVKALKNLETLTYISVDDWAYEVSGLKMITSLGIEVDENSDVSKLFTSLAALKSVKWLVLRGFRFRIMPSLDGISVLSHLSELKIVGLIPNLPNFPPKLLRLTLIDSCLEEDPMPKLEKLSELRFLKLRNSYTGQRMVISKFRNLEHMCIEELWHLRNIKVRQAALNLMSLEIRHCPYLHSLPEDIAKYTRRFGIVTTKKIETDLMPQMQRL